LALASPFGNQWQSVAMGRKRAFMATAGNRMNGLDRSNPAYGAIGMVAECTVPGLLRGGRRYVRSLQTLGCGTAGPTRTTIQQAAAMGNDGLSITWWRSFMPTKLRQLSGPHLGGNRSRPEGARCGMGGSEDRVREPGRPVGRLETRLRVGHDLRLGEHPSPG
jgi:hypothetical protein